MSAAWKQTTMTIRSADQVYTIRIETAEIDGGYIAEVLELPGCVSQGDSLDETVDNIIDAMILVLEVQSGQHLSVGRHEQPDADRLPTELTVPVRVAA
ncbi:Conserved hypothetical protein [Frankia alni ACN14a]|uniref:HicB-like antitoxin of toxin-antitoxin system domain-containing protein n=2 Tax=Frankiaceae TaxID=74712 RepID=Q0RB88_FRAAA|nr:Conserved hypothetical protein [Frankia alni ACN14a]